MSAAEEERVAGLASTGASDAQNAETVSYDPQHEHDFVIPPSVSDFARKLYNLLEDPLSNSSVVCWAPTGDHFFIKDTSVFSKTILPRFFNHSNFSSFVRQLNKFGFHKVKTAPFDSQTPWTFQHPYFHKDKPEDLHHIERKASSSHVSFDKGKTKAVSPSSGIPEEPADSEESMTEIKSELDSLRAINKELKTRLVDLERTNRALGLNLQSLEKKAFLQGEKIASVLQILSERDGPTAAASITQFIFQLAEPLDPELTFSGPNIGAHSGSVNNRRFFDAK